MFGGIIENAGTILVSILLLGAVTAIVMKLHKDRKQGKTSCGGNCGCCPMGSCCHKQS